MLVGDSGEHDPEVYAAAAREFPGRVAGIMIRAMRDAEVERARCGELFREIDGAAWILFRSGADLPGDLPAWVTSTPAETSSD